METGGCTRFSEMESRIGVVRVLGIDFPLFPNIKQKADMAFVGSICFKVS